MTDISEESLMRFSLTGLLVHKIGSRGNVPGCFTGIRGLCCDPWGVYVCDSGNQRVQIFDLDLIFVKYFWNGEIKLPTDIVIHSGSIYILSRDQNTIYCYSRGGTNLNSILLTGQEHQMTVAIFLTMDKKGNFLIAYNSINEIRIFSPDGVLKHILGRGHLRFLCGIAICLTNNIICVSQGNANDCFQKY